MQYEWIAGALIVSCLVFLILGIIILTRKPWFTGWLRGSLGFGCLLLAPGLGLLAVNIFSYHNLVSETPIATISFTEITGQQYSARVILPEGEETTFRLAGDLWQIDARIIKWSGPLSAIGFKPGYKLDRLQGRYIALDDERKLERTVYALSKPDIGFDIWETIQASRWLPWVDAVYGSAAYLPMIDGAVFSVSLANSGLVARPMNKPAESAITEWR